MEVMQVLQQLEIDWEKYVSGTPRNEVGRVILFLETFLTFERDYWSSFAWNSTG
jgi:hypothetical protein